MAGLRDIGEFIREQRRNAQISLRQLADQAGVSNPYLSQIERGLRKPSAEVLQQIATALRVSTPVMYLRAGLLDAGESQGVLAAIAADNGLSNRQKQTIAEIYEAFRRENLRVGPDPEPAGTAATVPATEPTATEPPDTLAVPTPKSGAAPKSGSGADSTSGAGTARKAGAAKSAGRSAGPKPPVMATEPPAPTEPATDLS